MITRPVFFDLRLPARLAGITIIMMAISISLTQIFMGLCFIAFFLDLFLKRKTAQADQRYSTSPAQADQHRPVGSGSSTSLARLRQKTAGFPPVLAAGGLLFAVLFLSALVHSALAPDMLGAFRSGFRDELGDVMLYSFGVLVWSIARDDADRRILLLSFEIFLAVLIVSGLAALFSEFRLMRLFMGEGRIASARNRPQHPFSFLGFGLFQPIGFMNTRLTYAGLLIMALPSLLANIALSLFPGASGAASAESSATNGASGAESSATNGASGAESSATNGASGVKSGGTRRRFFIFACRVFLGVGALFLLFANNTRSAQFGALFGLGLAVPALLKIIRPRKRSLAVAFVAAALFFGLVAGFYREQELHHVSRLKHKLSRYTDAYRPIIWAGSGDIFMQRPLFGVGPGNFKRSTLEWRDEFSRLHPTSWYFVNNAPAGHAHSDLLHLALVGGLPAALAFLLLCFLCVRAVFQCNGPAAFLLCGAAALFPAGLFQCYFQDDEVVVLFWCLLALGQVGQTVPADNRL